MENTENDAGNGEQGGTYVENNKRRDDEEDDDDDDAEPSTHTKPVKRIRKEKRKKTNTKILGPVGDNNPVKPAFAFASSFFSPRTDHSF